MTEQPSDTPAPGDAPVMVPLDPTGVPGLDEVLDGGIQRGSLAILVGLPGDGKTFDQDLPGQTLDIFSVQQFRRKGLDAAHNEIVDAARAAEAELVVLDGFRSVRELADYTVYALPPTPKNAARSHREEQDATTSLQDDTERPIVLVAEDEETIAETLAMIVEDAGYSAIVAYDGREALALARRYRPQLIITDLMMPYLSGADLIVAVRAEAAAAGQAPPPVVIVTAASRVRAEEAGADAVIAKPFDVTKVEAVIQKLLYNERQ
jgi:two-component system, chemotaxis family, chemotaxis protein CheY